MGQWHFVVARRQGNLGTLYIDNQLRGSASGTARNLAGYIGVGAGADIRDNVAYFRGVMDDLRIYDFALTETELSELYNYYFQDLTPPTPNPITWATPPTPAATHAITMTAATATDPSGVEYYFDCATPGCHDSGWQNDPTYTDIGLQVNTEYYYKVRARDKSAAMNQTADSEAASAIIILLDGQQGLSDWPRLLPAMAGSGLRLLRMHRSDR